MSLATGVRRLLPTNRTSKLLFHPVFFPQPATCSDPRNLFPHLQLSQRQMSSDVVQLGASPAFQGVLTPELGTLADLFAKYGYEIRIAGGAVRDLLMGKCPADIDLATTATPDQMKEMFTKENIRMINALGEKHGTITARINDAENFEVTTLRIDKVTDGRRAEVEFTKDWQLDANRRDLTINSMFLGLDGTVYDYFDGQTDLKNRKVRFVGNPVDRIQEDYLRILRYFRFYGRIAETCDNHDEETIRAIRDNVKGMEIISGERIWSEWRKILVGSFAGELTLKMVEVGLGQFIGLPASPDTDEFLSVWRRKQENGTKLEAQTLLSGLLRDEEDVMRLHGRLKLSGVERDTCLFIVSNRAPLPHPVPIRPYQYLFVDSKFKSNDTKLFITEVLKYRGDLLLAEEFGSWTPPRFPITGHHLKESGCPPGKLMSVVMNKLKEKWKESNFLMSVEELSGEIPQILDNLNPTELAMAHRSKKGKKK